MRRFKLSIICIALLLSACSKETHHYQAYVEGEFRYISASQPGQLIKLAVKRGEKVKAHQLLFRLLPAPEQMQLANAKANVEQAKYNLANLEKGQRPSEIKSIAEQINQAKADLHLASITLKRDRVLFEKKVLQQQMLDEQDTQFKAAKAKLAQLQAQMVTAKLGARDDLIQAAKAQLAANEALLKKAQWQLNQKLVFAPVAGVINDTYYYPGEQVAAYKPVLSLLGKNDKRIIFFIPEAKLSQIKLGEKIAIGCDGCQQTYYGFISYISPQAEYTPPVIYSRNSRKKLVYRIKARLQATASAFFHPGAPVQVTLL